jgi:exonuclease VII small subunit
MDLSALRKLSMTLKPLIEITEVLQKIENAEQQLASIKGSTVAAQREYDAMVSKTAQIKADAEKSASVKLANTNKEADEIVARAKISAESSTKLATENAMFKLNDLKKKIEKSETDLQESSDRLKKLVESVTSAEQRLKIAERSLAELRAAHAAVRI